MKIKQSLFLIILGIFVLGAFVIAEVAGNDNGQVKVAVDVLNVRSGPGLEYEIIDKLLLGEQYPINKESGAWINIQINNQDGWVANWLVERINTPAQVKNQTAEATGTNVNVRSGPSTSFSVIQQIQPGTKYPVVDQEGDWVKIQLTGDKFGWVANWLLAISEDSPTESTLNKDYVRINVDKLNVRSGPSTDYSIIGSLQRDELVKVIAVEQGWYKINFNEEIGYIAGEFVSEAAIENQPTVVILNPGTNLREGPSTNTKVVAIANVGEKFPIVSTSGDWYQIIISDGSTAYVAGWIVSVTGMENKIDKGIDKALKGKVIVVDPGHGGNDYGATGLHFKSLEKSLNLLVAGKLQKKLEAAGAKVVMTRTTDKKIYLQERVDIAINKKADAFISVHHNTNNNMSINGTITYYYSKSDKKLAEVVQKELIKQTGLTDLGARYGNFFVLRENPRLSILAELAFISNYQDELTARSENFQEKAAEGLFQGIIKYFAE